ncbi:MAG TPA: hypothetical protein VGR93_08495 [Candidatus Acidoferrales bacterium]|nr:hypothetical protein [Candidatus Acidoferrales bacterium]
MSARGSRIGFFVAICFAALATIGGGGTIFLEFRDHTSHFLGPAIELSLGLSLAVLALLGESSGRVRRTAFILRNSLIALFVLAVVLALMLFLVGPLH